MGQPLGVQTFIFNFGHKLQANSQVSLSDKAQQFMLANFVFLSRKDNRSIQDKAPSEYIKMMPPASLDSIPSSSIIRKIDLHFPIKTLSIYKLSCLQIQRTCCWHRLHSRQDNPSYENKPLRIKVNLLFLDFCKTRKTSL